MHLHGRQLRALIDSAASHSFVRPEFTSTTTSATDVRVHLGDQNTHLPVSGQTKINFTADGRPHNAWCLVAPTLREPLILGYDWLTANQVELCFRQRTCFLAATGQTLRWTAEPTTQRPTSHRVSTPTPQTQVVHTFPADFRTDFLELIAEYEPVFRDRGPPTTSVSHCIPLRENRPFRLANYRYSPAKKIIIATQVAEMLAEGIIEPSTSNYNSPIVLVTKKDGNPRFCIDYRRLNQQTEDEHAPLPLIADTLRDLGQATIFSTLDLRSGYWQVPMEPASKHLTAFSTPDGSSYQFTVMPFGLKNAPARFQKLMAQQVLCGIQNKFALAYLDDVVIYSRTWEEHLDHLRQVFDRLQRHGLRCTPKKCQFGTNRIEYLGHVVTAEDNQPLPLHLHRIQSSTPPTTRKQLRAFLGVCNWLREYVERFAELAAPLTDLLRPTKPFRWTTAASQAFQNLQEAMAKPLRLHRPDPSLPYILQTDASKIGIAAVLYQCKPGSEERRIISFSSARLNATQTNYHVNELECLAAIWAIRRYRPYLEDKPFILRTDSKALTWLQQTKDERSKLTRWALLLQEFTFNIQHCPGRLNELPDALSRQPDDTPVEHDDDVARLIPPQLTLLTAELPAAIKEAQRQDEGVRRLINRWTSATNHGPLEPGDAGLIHFYKVQDDLLWHRHRPNDQLVVPDHLQLQVMHHYHDSDTAGHPGGDETTRAIMSHYYWPRMKPTIRRYVSQCLLCAAVKRGPVQAPAALTAHKASKPWDIVSVDFMGPYLLSADKNRFVIVVMDLFSRWVEAKAVESITTPTTTRYLQHEVFERFGYPRAIITDNGPQFHSRAWDNALEQWGAQHWTTPIYHPRANPVERRNQEIKKCIRTSLQGRNPRHWDRHLPGALFNLRTRANAATGVTPSRALLGYDLPRPGDWFIAAPGQPQVPREQLFYEMNRHQRRYRRRYVRPENPRQPYRPGDHVMARVNTHEGLHQLRWTGPHLVTAAVSRYVYWIDRDGIPVKVHYDNLRYAPVPRAPALPGAPPQAPPVAVMDAVPGPP